MFSGSHAVASPIVIHDSAYGISSRTWNITANASYIDNQPFDGITINISATWGLLAPGSVWTYNDIYPSWLEPLKGVLKRVTHNYCKIVARPQVLVRVHAGCLDRNFDLRLFWIGFVETNGQRIQ